MTACRPLLLFAAATALLPPTSLPAQTSRSRPPEIDIRQTVNASYNFRKNEEPEMSADEYALYERIVGMLALNREFALKLLEPMAAAKAEATPAFLFLLGNVYFTDGQAAIAEGYYRRAVQAMPTFTRAWANLGNLLYTQGRYPEAIECFTKVTATGERDVQTLALLAYCLDHTGRRVGAEMNYVQALGLDPDHLDSLRGLMALSLDSGQFSRAEELLKQLIRLAPAERRNWTLYGNLLASQDRAVEAIGLLESAASLGLLEGEGLAALAGLYVRQGFHAEATGAFERLRVLDPALAATHRLSYLRTLIGGGRLADAEREIASLSPGLPADKRIELLETEAALRLAQERWPDARQVCETILRHDPLHGEALLGLGSSLKALGETAAAELVFDRASRIPEFAYRACLELADSALRNRLYARALEQLEKAASLQKDPPLDSYIARIKLLLSAP